MIINKGNVGYLFLLIAVVSGGAYIATKQYKPDYPSDYAKVAPPIDFPCVIDSEKVVFKIPETEINKMHIVYAVIDSIQYGILVPTLSNTIKITRGTSASYTAKIKNNIITDYEILKLLNGYKIKYNLYDLIIKADKKDKKYGIQRCLHPFCNICVDECREVKGEERIAIDLEVNDKGEVVPIYHSGYCPRCGICFVECPVGVLIQSGYFDEGKN